MLGSQEWCSGWNNIRNNSISSYYWLFFDRSWSYMMSERVKNALLITGIIVIVGLIILPVVA